MDEEFASLLKSRLFIPMEMTRSTVEFDEVVHGEDGKPYLSKEGIRYGLASYREDGGKEKFMVIDSPFIGFMLEPIFAEGISLRIQRGQESYDCMSS